ncbi:MAG: hypothetical protein U9N32_01395 [Spirochaetota bacterium]|nr:hypothetical protein [Spirochaetota bacterium]
MKRRVYIETSVISYLTARPSKTIIGAAHQQITTAWWEKRNDYLLTCNCKHIANPEIQRNIAQYLDEIGLYLPFICTPEELLGEDNVD